ncbi:MAG TPA: STAS domain-containing protein [Candidatus Limnocylindria bacterium]|nr:STAS domain-containing protein [Candidatus Limnocylindria bacterium]
MQERLADKAKVRHQDGVAIVDLPARIDGSAEQTLNDAYAEASEHGAGRVLLNFCGVEFLSSTGIALIVGLLARSRKDGKRISSCGLSDHYREIFEITRLADFMRIYGDERSAIAGS